MGVSAATVAAISASSGSVGDSETSAAVAATNVGPREGALQDLLLRTQHRLGGDRVNGRGLRVVVAEDLDGGSSPAAPARVPSRAARALDRLTEPAHVVGLADREAVALNEILQ